jgi:uncharacterized protein YhdP
MEEFNIGAQIKAVLESKGMSVTEFAKRINKSRENCYSIFARKTIDTGLLQTISTVLAHDFFMQFSSSYQQMSEETQKLRAQILPIVDTGTTSLLAGLALNPAVGLTAFVAQWLLKNPLSRASSQEFIIDGSWGNPRVTRIDNRP